MTAPRVLLLALFAAACSSPYTGRHDPEGTSELAAAMAELRQQQADFGSSVELPRTYDFPGAGRVIVRELSLDGYPGNTYVRCRFTYQNTTGKPVMHATVSLDVLNAAGKLVARQSSVCIIPVPMPIADGSYFADELRTKTFGAQATPGWTWRISCQPQFDPGDSYVPAATTGGR